MYDESDGESKEVAAWPGVKMEDEGNGWYSYNQVGWLNSQVIFSNAGASQNQDKINQVFKLMVKCGIKMGFGINQIQMGQL